MDFTLPNSTLGLPSSRVEIVREPKPRLTSVKNAFRTWWSVYEAAERSDFRGWFYLPTLDPGAQLTALARTALAERIDFLYKNVGAVRMIIDGLALDEVGTGLWPKWCTGNAPFDKAITDAFHYAYHDPRIFSADGESDYYGAQVNIRRMIRLYGDGFGQFLRPADGNIFPQCSILAGWRIGSDVPGNLDPRWRDGIMRNEMGRRLAVNVLAVNPTFGPASPDKTGTVVQGDDILHFHDEFLPGENRGVSPLAAIAKKLFRREDVYKALMNGTLARERLGFAIESPEDGSAGPQIAAAGEGDEQVVTNIDGSQYTLRRLFGPDAGEEIEIPRLPAGAKISMLESTRPGTAQMDFLDNILRESAWAAIYPAEYVFFLAGMGQGTVARLVLDRVMGLIRARRAFQLIPQFCHRWNVYAAWQMIKSGMFDDIAGGVPANWWQHKLMADKDKSVDVGREGKLYDDRVATGKMSIDSYHALAGEDASDVEDENMARIKARMVKLQQINKDTEQARTASGMPPFTYWDIWPRSVNSQQPTPSDPDPGKIED